ncbi:tetratricopeptide repeat protein [Hymenobacter aerilatus]|uniref:Tetratricopeptide repeat protein n=1 Tax=Hymenobacter aerilatus TaxID=2932251 RepID=A0A8T9SZ04_9BACT|nr:tetratricopeptide repeat protein [Hymenobacter aerilatus]UOR05056.1 tetratricopeptide repeat protein [Hymenobacter aerilatus]
MIFLGSSRITAALLLAGGSFLAATAQAQTNIAILQKADALVGERKYASAFQVLQKYDPRNERPAVVLQKEDIALRYNVGHSQYRRFAFKDVQLTDNLENFRSPDSTYTLTPFPLGRALRTLKARYPNDYKLDRGLGDYYFAVQQCNCAETSKEEDDLFPLIIQYYDVAHEHGYGDYSSYYAQGYSYQRLGMFQESVAPFLRSIELRKNYPESHLNLAFVYLELKQFEKAKEQAQLAVELFPDEQHKSDANFLLKTVEERLQGKEAVAPKPTATPQKGTKKPARKRVI